MRLPLFPFQFKLWSEQPSEIKSFDVKSAGDGRFLLVTYNIGCVNVHFKKLKIEENELKLVSESTSQEQILALSRLDDFQYSGNHVYFIHGNQRGDDSIL